MSMREIIWKLRDRLESLLTSLGLSLPGKVAPVTAGRSIKNTIYNILHELGV